MIGSAITDAKGQPLEQYKKLEKSNYQPNNEVKELFARCQKDYQIAWNLQHRSFDEFDGLSLLQRTKLDQETFGAFVGATYVPEHKRWRWKGRKNTARNKLMGILAHMISGILYPVVHASNEEDEADKMSARVMRIIIENHLKKAGYEIKFLYMVLSALVNPAVIVKVDYVEAFQRIKEKLSNGQIKVTEAVDGLLSGLVLNIKTIDQFLIADFYTPDVQIQPFTIEIERIPWDTARKIYGTCDDFKYVEAGKTRVFLTGQDNNVLYDIEWTEADQYSVQVATFRYRDEDLEAVWVGGVFMGEKDNVYNNNPFKNRRLALIGDEWKSIPVYPFAKSGFEPIDPTGRFFYFKSGAFKEYWDDKSINEMYQLLQDATKLDVFKPTFIDGIQKVDSTVFRPGAVVPVPAGAGVTQYNMSPNIKGAMDVLLKNEQDMSESTQDRSMSGVTDPNSTATAVVQQQNQARIILGLFGVMTADLVKQIGELVKDCTVQHTTIGEIDATIPGTLNMKYKTILAKGKDKGKNITNRIVFKTDLVGKDMTEEEKDKYEWKLWREAGGIDSDQYIYHVNPYKFARMQYDMYVDVEQMLSKAMGNYRLRKTLAFQAFTHPEVKPFVDMKNVVDDFVIDEFAEGDPERYRLKGNVNDLMSSVMGGAPQGPETPSQPQEGVESAALAAMMA